jgi:hypothetical protein
LEFALLSSYTQPFWQLNGLQRKFTKKGYKNFFCGRKFTKHPINQKTSAAGWLCYNLLK